MSGFVCEFSGMVSLLRLAWAGEGKPQTLMSWGCLWVEMQRGGRDRMKEEERMLVHLCYGAIQQA